MFSASTVPDPDFAAYAAGGCSLSFRRLVDRHLPAVHATAVRTLGLHAALADDVAQGVFILLARKATVLPPAIVVPAWLHRQTVRLALNSLRTERRRVNRESTAAALHTMNSTDDDALWRDLKPHVDRAMLRLPAADREALALRFLEKKNLREVGETLGLSTAAAQKRIERALEKMRHHLAPHTAHTLTVLLLAGVITTYSAPAAPVALAAGIAGGALAAPAPSVFNTLLTIMTQTKALCSGAALGLVLGVMCAAWPQHTAPQNAKPEAGTGAHEAADSLPVLASRAVARPLAPRADATAEELLAQFQEIIAQPDNERTRLMVSFWLEKVPQAAWPEFVRLADTRLRSDLRHRWMPQLAQQWARVAPLEALPALMGLSLGDVAFNAWHTEDASAAQRWMVGHQDDPAVQRCLPGFVSIVAHTLLMESPESLVRWALQLQGDDLRKAALQVFISGPRHQSPEAEVAALQMLSTALPDDEAFSRGIIQSWMNVRLDNSGMEGMRALTDWLKAQAPGAQRDAMASMLFNSALRKENKSILEAALTLRPDLTMQEQLRQAILEGQGIELHAHAWMLPHITGPDRDVLLLEAARQIIPANRNHYSDNHGHALIWAAEISDPAVRDPLVYGLYQDMLKFHDNNYSPVEKAEARIKTLNFPPEVMAVVERARRDFKPIHGIQQ